MIQAIALRFGYVEDCCLDWLVFQAECPEEQTKEEAFLSLTEFLYLKFMQNRPTNNKCCQATITSIPDSVYCSKCGNRLENNGFNYYDWLYFLEEIRTNTIDGFEYSVDTDNPNGWDAALFAFGIPDHDMIIVPEQAAEMLSYAVSILHPETQDEIEENITLNPAALDADYHALLKVEAR